MLADAGPSSSPPPADAMPREQEALERRATEVRAQPRAHAARGLAYVIV